VSNFVFHEVKEVKDKISLINEVIRVLKPQGKFFIQDEIYNKSSYGNSKVFYARLQKLGLKEITLTPTYKEIQLPPLIKKFSYPHF